jgi:hypothetical protein
MSSLKYYHMRNFEDHDYVIKHNGFIRVLGFSAGLGNKIGLEKVFSPRYIRIDTIIGIKELSRLTAYGERTLVEIKIKEKDSHETFYTVFSSADKMFEYVFDKRWNADNVKALDDTFGSFLTDRYMEAISKESTKLFGHEVYYEAGIKKIFLQHCQIDSNSSCEKTLFAVGDSAVFCDCEITHGVASNLYVVTQDEDDNYLFGDVWQRCTLNSFKKDIRISKRSFRESWPLFMHCPELLFAFFGRNESHWSYDEKNIFNHLDDKWTYDGSLRLEIAGKDGFNIVDGYEYTTDSGFILIRVTLKDGGDAMLLLDKDNLLGGSALPEPC